MQKRFELSVQSQVNLVHVNWFSTQLYIIEKLSRKIQILRLRFLNFYLSNYNLV